MTRKNPFRIIRVTAATVGIIALAGFFAFMIWSAVVMSIEESGPEVLWQVPLAFAAAIGAIALIAFICSVIANLWRKAEQRWDRKGRA